MTDKELRLKIINEIFDNRFEAVSHMLVMPFLSGQAIDIDEMKRLKDMVFTDIVNSGNAFESMAEMAIFTAEGVAMKAFTAFAKQVAKQWNEDNDKTKHNHLYYDIDVKIREKTGDTTNA